MRGSAGVTVEFRSVQFSSVQSVDRLIWQERFSRDPRQVVFCFCFCVCGRTWWAVPAFAGMSTLKCCLSTISSADRTCRDVHSEMMSVHNFLCRLRVQGCPLRNDVRPQFPLPIAETPTLCPEGEFGKRCRGTWHVQTCQFPSLGSRQSRFLWAYKEVDLVPHSDRSTGLCLSVCLSLSLLLSLSRSGLITLFRFRFFSFCFVACLFSVYFYLCMCLDYSQGCVYAKCANLK